VIWSFLATRSAIDTSSSRLSFGPYCRVRCIHAGEFIQLNPLIRRLMRRISSEVQAFT
jgi:hypothetical protein